MTLSIEYENLAKVNQDFVTQFQETLQNVLTRGWYIRGKQCENFETAFAQYIGTQYCIGLANGYDALILALKALQLPEKSEVLVAANAYVACVLSIVRAGLVPILVEPDNTGNIDVQKIETKITPKTRVIMPVHLYGNPCNMTAINLLAQRYNLHIIEDCAQAHGARWDGKKIGTFSTISAFSFYPTKNLGALGDAGAVLTDDESLAKTLRALGNYGSQVKYHNDIIGYNSRLDEIQAGFLQVKLPFLDKLNAHKRALAAIYDTHLDARFQKLHVAPEAFCVYHIYPILHPHRDDLRSYLAHNGITTEVHYPIPPYRQKALQHYWEGEQYPISDAWHQSILSLPISYAHTPEDIKRVCDTMNAYRELSA